MPDETTAPNLQAPGPNLQVQRQVDPYLQTFPGSYPKTYPETYQVTLDNVTHQLPDLVRMNGVLISYLKQKMDTAIMAETTTGQTVEMENGGPFDLQECAKFVAVVNTMMKTVRDNHRHILSVLAHQQQAQILQEERARKADLFEGRSKSVEFDESNSHLALNGLVQALTAIGAEERQEAAAQEETSQGELSQEELSQGEMEKNKNAAQSRAKRAAILRIEFAENNESGRAKKRGSGAYKDLSGSLVDDMPDTDS